MYVRDLEGNEYVTMMTHTIEDELNGNVTFEAIIEPNKPNLMFLDKLTEMWELVDDNETAYKILYVRKQGQGDTLHAQIKAIPLFYNDFQRQRNYEEYNQSLTAMTALDIIFNGSSYNYVLQSSFSSLEWEGFGGGETRMSMFQRWLNRSEAEFEIEGSTVYIDKIVGQDTSIQYRHRLNASNIVQETDASELYTYAQGYADYEDSDDGGWENANITDYYESPLINLIGRYDGPPIKDGRIKHKSVLQKQLKTLVDESLKISVTAGIHDLITQGYPIAQAKNGDRVFLIDERIGLKEEVRVVGRQITRDWTGKILDINLTFGSQGIVRRHQAKLNSAIKAVNDILSGKTKIPFNVLDVAVMEATKALKNAQSELAFPDSGGILAVDKTNPNNVVLFNSAGVGVSNDGGHTFRNALTGRGLVAERLIGNILIGQQLIIENESNTFKVDGDGVEINGGSLKITNGLPDSQIKGADKWNVQGTFINHEGIYTGSLTANQVQLGFNNIGSQVKISSAGLTTYIGGLRTSLLSGSGHSFYRDGYEVGEIGTSAWVDDPNYHGLLFRLEHDADYMTWAFRRNPGDPNPTTMLAWHKTGSKDSKGFSFYDHLNISSLYNLYVRTISTTGYTSGNRHLQLQNRTWDGRDGVALVRGSNADGAKLWLHSSRAALISSGNAYIEVGQDSTGNFVQSVDIRNRAYQSSSNVHVTNAGTLGFTSSARKYKRNIENLSKKYAYRFFDNVNPAFYKAKDTADADLNYSYYGYIADDVAPIEPRLVQFDDDGEPATFNYDRVPALLHVVLKSEVKRINELEQQLAEYKDRFEMLENRISELEK